MRKILFIVLAMLVCTGLAKADGELDKRLTPFDKQRLAKLDATVTSALAEARAATREVTTRWSRGTNRSSVRATARVKAMRPTETVTSRTAAGRASQ